MVTVTEPGAVPDVGATESHASLADAVKPTEAPLEVERFTGSDPAPVKLNDEGLAEIDGFAEGVPAMLSVTGIVRAGAPLPGVMVTVPL